MPRVWQGKNRHRLKRDLPFRSPQNRIEQVSVDIQVIPATASLLLASFAPTVGLPLLVIPGKAAFVLTTFAPIVSTPRVVLPSTAPLILTRFAPKIATPRLVTPATVPLALTPFAPTVSAPQAVSVTPNTANLFLTRYAPSLPDLIAGSPGGYGAGTLASFPDDDHFAGPPYRQPHEVEDQPLEVPDITPVLPLVAKVDNRPAIIALYESHAIDEDTFVALLAAA